MEENPLKLGGPGRIVEIDESCVSGVPKHHRGKHSDYQKWVIGGNYLINYAIFSDVQKLLCKQITAFFCVHCTEL